MIPKAIGPTMNYNRIWVTFNRWHRIMLHVAHIGTWKRFNVDLLFEARLGKVTVIDVTNHAVAQNRNVPFSVTLAFIPSWLSVRRYRVQLRSFLHNNIRSSS